MRTIGGYVSYVSHITSDHFVVIMVNILKMNKAPSPKGEETPYSMLIRQDWEKWYPQYLKSTAWAKLSGEVIARAGGRCEICGHTAQQVHHLTYANVGNENLEDLQSVCRPCHRQIHNLKPFGD